MFTLEQIETAHAKTLSGADFPSYIREIKALGVTRFQTFVTDCHTLYSGADGYQITSGAKYEPLRISDILDIGCFKEGLKDNQEGGNTFFEFCNICATSGVNSWIMDLEKMSCTYYDFHDAMVLTEMIPH